MNRLASRIEETRIKLDALEPAKREALEETLEISFEEAFEFQQLQAQAHAAGIITPEEAMVIYASIGESAAGWKAHTDLATKIVVTLTAEELLKRRIAERRAS